MINLEFADNAQLRFGQTSELPVCPNNTALYFMVIVQDTLEIASFNCDVRGLNNFHKAVSNIEDHEGVLILCNWKGQYQSHSFVCDKDEILDMVKSSLGDNFTDELPSGLSY
ncbi:hypothetical protein [Vibrio crassostreae]|uniref:hypothetical protein n=1 Tax=Vibrio crassostreae TaxID=246167 RepID=UPI001B305B94|nr:hypothetical protein [Vibrio crassostreae]